MRKISLILLGIFVACAAISQDLENGLIAYWPLNGNTIETTGNYNPTGQSGIIKVANRSGSANSAYYFNGTNGKIQFPDITIFDGTISFVMNASRLDDGSGRAMQFMKRSDQNNRIYFGSSYPRFRIETDTDGDVASFNTDFEINKWYHITFTKSGNDISIYIDGRYIETKTVADPKLVLDKIGSGVDYRNYQGILDEIRIYNRPLSAEEVLMLYNLSSDPSSPWLQYADVTYKLGKVGIGTSKTSSNSGEHMLAVDGSIGTRKVVVETETWSDFVFDDNYEIKNLEEVEAFIEQNNHLPEIPSEKEVLDEGIDLGDMDAKLLMKIEELTLYLIEQNKRIKALETKNEELMQLIKDE